MLKPLKKLDIVISIFNQEEIIERVLYGVFKNTTTSFHLILVFDGCSDRTKPRALAYIRKAKPRLLHELTIRDTPNLFELRANNFGFKLAKTDYLITLQDDMIIKEYGWERRLTYPLRAFDDVLAVTARTAQDIQEIGQEGERYMNRASRELGTLPRDIFAVRDVICRGPIAFRTDYLQELNYLNDNYAPGALDDADLSLRAWIQRKWKVGSFWINYLSKQAWSKVNAPDSTMKAWDSWRRNLIRISENFNEYLASGIKHTQDYHIKEKEIDYVVRSQPFAERIRWASHYPLRLDKRSIKMAWRKNKRKTLETVKKPIMGMIGFVFGPRLRKVAAEQGLKKVLVLFLREKK